MLRSMTGFGRAQGQVSGVEYGVEVRSANNRYQKISTKLPEALFHMEADVEMLIRTRVSRGTVTLTVHMKPSDDRAAYKVNTAAVAAYVDQLKALQVEANPMLRIDLGALLHLPGVCQEPDLEDVVEETREGLMELIGRALDGLVGMRECEGRGLQEDLLKNCDIVSKGVAKVAARAPEAIKDYQQRLAARVEELTRGTDVAIDPHALATEVAIFAERSDIAEEVARLNLHIEQFRQNVDGDGPAGRKLDFIAQELLREANTIASKSNDTETAREAVEIKTAIDRIKEQVQNVE